ncbi:unnamed protein product [Phyllotreta striolata]|uniref:NADP-dependent oxidoreductase domain-containing protein n=1 Tax=Phyllotreta striolata TaxID=444603 RepID=A0A9N9XK11_PHYSR|nr:unnamed protein product [Phyllotreta striolata]
MREGVTKMNTFLSAGLLVFLFNATWGMEYRNNGGYKIPALGLGTYTVTNETELTSALDEALRIGYRHIDTASRYKNEHIVGKVLNEWISSGKVKREDLFVTTKLASADVFPDRVENALKSSLLKLRLDYVDLYLIHFPVATGVENGADVAYPTDLVGVWRKMEEQVEAGRAKTIGVSNFNITQISRIKKIAKIQPANVQVEMHLYFQQKELRNFANENNLTVVAYSPLGTPGVNKYFLSKNITQVKLPDILHDEVVDKIAQKHKKTNAQIALRFIIQSGLVAIPKSTNPKRLRENIDIFDFSLDDEDMQKLADLDKGKKAKIFTMQYIAPNIVENSEYPFHDNI